MKQWCVFLLTLAAALDPEFTMSDGTTFRVMLSAAGGHEELDGCNFPCAQSCVLYASEIAPGANLLTSDEVRHCVQYCGCSAFIPQVPISASGASPPKDQKGSQPAATTGIALTPECSARCGTVCENESPACLETCSQHFCSMQEIYSPEQVSVPVLIVVADLLLLIISIGVIHALYRRLSGKTKKKQWKSEAIEAPYRRLDY